ncbi:MAG: DUF4351 domain-containing protein [Crocosphaera sp.]
MRRDSIFYKLFQTYPATRYEVEEMLDITFEETQFYQDIEQTGREKGRKEGREEGKKSLILRQLTKRVGQLSPEVYQKIENLSLEQLENLGEALLDFSSMTDLENWLDENRKEN